jgi:hypothetical protein
MSLPCILPVPTINGFVADGIRAGHDLLYPQPLCLCRAGQHQGPGGAACKDAVKVWRGRAAARQGEMSERRRPGTSAAGVASMWPCREWCRGPCRACYSTSHVAAIALEAWRSEVKPVAGRGVPTGGGGPVPRLGGSLRPGRRMRAGAFRAAGFAAPSLRTSACWRSMWQGYGRCGVLSEGTGTASLQCCGCSKLGARVAAGRRCRKLCKRVADPSHTLSSAADACTRKTARQPLNPPHSALSAHVRSHTPRLKAKGKGQVRWSCWDSNPDLPRLRTSVTPQPLTPRARHRAAQRGGPTNKAPSLLFFGTVRCQAARRRVTQRAEATAPTLRSASASALDTKSTVACWQPRALRQPRPLGSHAGRARGIPVRHWLTRPCSERAAPHLGGRPITALAAPRLDAGPHRVALLTW